MTKLLQLLLLGLMTTTLLIGAAECPPPGDDDDATGDDDDASDDDDATAGDDDDATPIGSTTVQGEVIALDRESGAILSAQDYAGRAGGLILYVLPDATDLSVIFGKMTMTGPGAYSVTINNYAGPVDVVAVVDEDKNYVIDNEDVAREYAFNPLATLGNDTTVSGVNVYVDLARRDGGGGGDDDDDNGGDCSATELNGDVLLNGYPDGPVVVTTNSADLSDGPRELAPLAGPDDWSVAECNSHGTTAILGSLDADGNGFWEPSDPWGDAPGNPFVLGLGTVNGITVTIPSTEPITPPSPTTYVELTGTVAYDSFLTGNIIVAATAANTNGQLFSQQTLAAPGPFNLVAPAGTENVLIWAVLDDNSDGAYDVTSDPYDAEGPLNVGNGASGIALELGASNPIPGSISGEVTYDGPVGAGDCSTVGLFDTEPTATTAQPIDAAPPVFGPTYPLAFDFTGVMPGQYWVAAYLDVNCDNPTGPGAEDPDGQVTWPIQLPDGGDITGVAVEMSL